MQSFTRTLRLASLSRPSFRPAAAAAAAAVAVAAPRPFSQHARALVKEDASRSPEELDRIKHEQLDKQKRGEGHWHEELASAGESNVAADKEKVHDHDSHMEDLQKEGASKAEKDHPEGKAEH
ncbi:hypothetical protein MBLNU459_g5852t1 [Dothideomycetes sp. NU459]